MNDDEFEEWKRDTERIIRSNNRILLGTKIFLIIAIPTIIFIAISIIILSMMIGLGVGG